MASCFVTAIGTGVGKTLVTAALAYQLQQAKKNVAAYKPVISGYEDARVAESDSGVLLQAVGKPVVAEEIERISPWRYEKPLSPHLAAEKEGLAIDTEALVQWCQPLADSADVVLIEGVGGIMVPLTREFLVLDWMKALNWPVILVSSSYLGAINHTLLSYQALACAGLRVAGIVVSQASEGDVGLEDSCDAIRTFALHSVPIISISRMEETDTPWKSVPSLLSLIA